MDERRGASGALERENVELEGEELDEDEEFEEGDEEEEDDVEDGDRRSRLSAESKSSIGAESGAPQLETLTVPSSLWLPERDLHSDADVSAHLLSEVPVEYSLQPLESIESKYQVVRCREDAVVRVRYQAAEGQTENQPQFPGCPASLELSSPSSTRTTPSVLDSGLSKLEVVKHEDQKLKCATSVPSMKPTSTDGYSWRKYGQKQVKSPIGSRSYYRCTYTDCHAKKIEFCDHSNCVIDIIYRSQHNHNPLRKISGTKVSRVASSVMPVVGRKYTAQCISELDDSAQPRCSEDLAQKVAPIHQMKQQNSANLAEDVGVNVKEENGVEPDHKRKLKKSGAALQSSLLKPGKKPKFIVHAAVDVGISGDGYRWRKYGQKMVKGNPYPRNYYRCTSAGCPVRKHIERAVDSTDAMVITYKGKHDHDMPVPKKRHGPPSGPLVAVAAPASMDNVQLEKTDPPQIQLSTTQWSVDKEGELTSETLDLGGKKVTESARTLLSIGIEIKPC